MVFNQLDDLIAFLLTQSCYIGSDISDLQLRLMNDSLLENNITFIEQVKFSQLIPSESQIFLLCTHEIYLEINSRFPKIIFLLVSDPRFFFYELHNTISQLRPKYDFESVISGSSQVHPSVDIPKFGVRIGENSVIGEFVSIKSGTSIGHNCVIQAGVRLGDSGFEFKRTSKGIITVVHDAGLIIEDHVQVGANSTLGRGFMGKDTLIGEQTKLDFGVSIAHRSRIGKRVFIAAGVVVSGSTEIGSDTWIGPSAVLSNGLTIGEGSHIALGSVVFKSFPEKSWLMGDPARNIPKG